MSRDKVRLESSDYRGTGIVNHLSRLAEQEYGNEREERDGVGRVGVAAVVADGRGGAAVAAEDQEDPWIRENAFCSFLIC